MTESARGQVVFELPHPRADGATHLLLDPLELIEKLTLLIPPPRVRTLRFHGVLAPHAAWRSAVIPGRPEAQEDGSRAARPGAGAGPPAVPRGRAWAALLRRRRILPTLSHTAVAACLRHVVVPLFRRAGWPVQRVHP